MATVVIIHAAEDALPARALAEKLRQAKLTVELEKGAGAEVRDAAKAGQLSLALWSPRSVGNAALAEDVAFAKSKGKFVHALMQNAKLPDQFKNDKAIDLTGWRGEDEFPAWRQLAQEVTSKVGAAPLPPPAPRPPSGFFQPGAQNIAPGAGQQAAPAGGQQRRPAAPAQRPPQQAARQAPPPPRPAPQAQRSTPQPARSFDSAPEPKKGGGMVMIAIVTFLIVAALGGGGYYFWSQQQSAQAASSAWDDVPHNDAAAIRAFLAGNPGTHRADAQAALTQLEEQSFDAARDADTIEAFQGFLRDFPQSAHAMDARGRIAELQSMPDQTATPEGTDATTTTTTAPNPDLAPPGATTPPAATAPDATSGGPAQLTPPATTTQPPTP